MFHHDAHSEVWSKIQRCLKHDDIEGAKALWHQSLPTLAQHYDDLRMLYYVGRHGLRDAYSYACSTLGYLKDSSPDTLRQRLSIFRYSAEQPMRGHEDISKWMIEDLAHVLGITADAFPPACSDMPEELAREIAEHNAQHP